MNGRPGAWVAQVDLDRSSLVRGVARPRRRDDQRARVLVRLHGEVLGFVTVALDGGDISRGSVLGAAGLQLSGRLAHHLAIDGLSVSEAMAGATWPCQHRSAAPVGPPITVVVCTRDRPESLATCLKLLAQLEYGDFDVVVVDNSRSGDGANECVERMVGDDPRFRYVREPSGGLSRARNRGLAEARSGVVAFTDDDVEVDPAWLAHLAVGFARSPDVGCVTGLVPAVELDHPAQRYFDHRFSWGTRIDPRSYSLADRRDESPLYPYSPGLFGTGANFAVDRDLLLALGGFDEALGAGTPAGGGEELDVFVRILRAGRAIAYQPSAVVWHRHRADMPALRSQLFRYGAGLTAFLAKYAFDPETTGDILARGPAGIRRLWSTWSPASIGIRPPARLVLAEVAGMVVGPVAYAQGRRRARSPQAVHGG